MKWVKKIWYPCSENDLLDHQQRHIILSNRIAVLVFLAAWIFLGLQWLIDAPAACKNLPIILPVLLLATTPFLNHIRQYHAATIVLAFFFPVYMFSTGIVQNVRYHPDGDHFYDPRIPLLLGSVIPFFLWDSREVALLLLSVITGICAILLFNPTLQFFDPFFSQHPASGNLYTATDIIIVLTYLLLSCMSFLFLTLQEKTERAFEYS